MPVMAEVDFFTTMNGSLNTSLQEDDQYCDKGSSPVRNENSGVVASDLDGKLDNGERNSAGNKSLSTQDGDVPQNMEQTLDSVAVDMKQTSSEVSFDMPSDLGNNEDSKTQCSSSENLECNGQTVILPNASSLAQTNNCASEILQVSTEHISTDKLPDASQSSEHKSGFPLPLNASLVDSVTTSSYFTRSAKKARLSSPVTHEDTAAQSTTCSFVTPGTPTTSFLANSTKSVTTFAIAMPESIKPAATISAPAVAQDVSKITAVTCVRTSSNSSLSNSSKPITTFAISLHESNEPAATILAPTGASDVLQTTAVTHVVTPQMLAQALAMCTLPMNASATSTMAANSSTPLAIPSLANKVEDLEPTSISSNMATISSPSFPSTITSNSTALVAIPVPTTKLDPEVSNGSSSSISNNVATISSSSFPSTSNSKALVAIPVPMTKLDPEVPIASSNVTANVTQTTVAVKLCADNAALESLPIANSSTAHPDIPAIFPDFTPCNKCNSILVCSCPGPFSTGEGSGAVPKCTTCQASCQGDCTCNGMKANQVNDVNSSEQDVKPQIFPVVVSEYVYCES